MPEYMVMVLEDEVEQPPSEMKALVEGHTAFAKKLRQLDAYVDSERLRPSAERRRVSTSGGQARVESGPFSDAALGGYYVLKAESLDAALALAEQCPLSPGGALEVRPLMKGNLTAEKSSEQGRVFAFSVLGNAPNEPGWVEVMDRIDSQTHNQFPTDRFLGGVRLQPPGRGRRMVSDGAKRTLFDGPFLESKEVIGGVFFMRMASLDEAIKWASQTPFVQHGTLEIRELWRS